CYNFNCRVPAWSAGKSGILVSAALLIFLTLQNQKSPSAREKPAYYRRSLMIKFRIYSLMFASPLGFIYPNFFAFAFAFFFTASGTLTTINTDFIFPPPL